MYKLKRTFLPDLLTTWQPADQNGFRVHSCLFRPAGTGCRKSCQQYGLCSEVIYNATCWGGVHGTRHHQGVLTSGCYGVYDTAHYGDQAAKTTSETGVWSYHHLYVCNVVYTVFQSCMLLALVECSGMVGNRYSGLTHSHSDNQATGCRSDSANARNMRPHDDDSVQLTSFVDTVQWFVRNNGAGA